jgi:hypothetical protein
MVARRESDQARDGGRGLPADGCPYPRPFPPGFHDCPAHQPAYFIALTTGYEPMKPVWTCSRLVPGNVPGIPARFYGRCRIGDLERRLAWVEGLHAQRLATLRELSLELTGATATIAAELMSAKGAQLQAEPDTDEHAAATLRLRAVCDRWLRLFVAFLERHDASLRSIDFPPEALRTLIDEMLDEWIAQPHTAPPEISDEMMQLFPEDVHILLRPGGGDEPRAEAR